MNKLISILAITAVMMFGLQMFSQNKADVDLWGNVGFVKGLPGSDGFHYTNTFSFAERDHPWVNHEWLAEYLFHLAYTSFDNTGLLLLKLLLGVCTLILICLGIKNNCRSGIVQFFSLILILSTMGYGFSTRPHLFTYLIYAIFLLILKRNPNNKIFMLIVIPLIGILWANLHGAFFLGIMLMLIFAFGKALSRLQNKQEVVWMPVSVAVLLIAMSFINPYGPKLWDFIFQSALKTRPYLSEWAPFNPAKHLGDHIDFVALTIFSILAISFSRRPRSIPWLLVLLVSLVGAVLMRRNIPLFAITAAFVIPEHLEDTAGNHLEKITSAIPRPALALILSLFILTTGWYTVAFNKINPTEIEIPQNKFPEESLVFIKENNIKGNAIVFFDWAEYFIWHLYPNSSVFLDGRFRSAYSTQTIDDYTNFIYLGPNWDNALTNYDTDIVLIYKENPVFKEMLQRKGWILAHNNQLNALFLRTDKHSSFMHALANGNVRKPVISGRALFP
ncbi:MAG: hypothetical protein KAH23_01115 [Kiritimatiellae bacterium]|nr:hypothetical protein [Kiritimatiellia bacterium]